ncbi:CHAT domain-containing protein [Candidatus Albibeggiatoa sp. nov. NOAA]|uniref:CHAT domain-containing protein n=1 Tax=Candidatus Albibeggiatoa sp. nov. NOAA TaxID=3162724 RepID=UPI003304918C|nr:CHAT domain-containing protein [Thiotrichaceae bacterium]
MPQEIVIHFSTPEQFSIRYDDGYDVDIADNLSFNNPINDEDYQDIGWYLETYSSSYIAEPDDNRAKRIEQQLSNWGGELFKSVFLQNRVAQRLFDRFQDTEDKRYITISAVYPQILSLPWELLKDPDGTYLFNENPRIAVRRSLRTRGGRKARQVKAKKVIRLLFVVSRPKGAGFIDPRREAQAVIAALEKQNINQVEVEFLRQATFDALVERLENEDLPTIDIVHFDGHGVFDSSGQLAAKSVDSKWAKKGDADITNMGYLLFEDDKGDKALVSAEMLGEMLNQQNISIMVLSACQSSKQAGDEALNSVAARLVHAGIPSVLAMSHSVLVSTTLLLFEEFYKQLASGKLTGEALENARRYLFRHTERGQRRYGEREFELHLQDWFIPTLYQNPRDRALLKKASVETVEAVNWHNLQPYQLEHEFFGRSQELWDLERWLLQGAKRITIAGFGGQGKTALAIELGCWLRQKGWFEKLIFVDYKAFQGVDAVSYAVSSLAVVLGESLLDAQAAQQALAKVSSVIILDNVESLEADTLAALLSTVSQWSQQARIVLTTRQISGFSHADFPMQGSLVHRHMVLEGLRETDAVAYLQYLLSLPPEIDPNVVHESERSYRDYARLLGLVKCHPLSIQTLAYLLKTERLARIEKDLSKLMAELPDNPVLASLQLSISRLDDKAQQYLPLLGVFQGGAFENMLLNITEIPEEKWATLRPLLESTGLIQVETLPNIKYPYLQFHPALSTALASNNAELRQRHQQGYYELSGYLYLEDNKNPLKTRTIVKRELANLLFAVKGALTDASDDAVEFVVKVNKFLNYFGLQRDLAQLNQQAAILAQQVGTDNWFFNQAGYGEQLFNAGHYARATEVFTEILNSLGSDASYQRCSTLIFLGRCFRFQGQATSAIDYYQQGLDTAQQLEQSQQVQRQTGVLYTELADVLTNIGDYQQAQIAYEQGLAIATKQNDERQIGVVNGQLGSLDLYQGNLAEAEQHYQATLAIFQQFNEPSTEAIYLHQLGRVYGEVKQWDAAEQAYRQAANIKEAQGNLASAAKTWNNLALVTKNMGKLADAEMWYRKAIEGGQKTQDWLTTAKALQNLANLLQNQPERLTEAQQLAEQALEINKTLDPATAQIWKTYDILADIADKQSDTQTAKNYRRLAREAKANFAGTRYELKQQHGNLILGTVAAIDDAEVRNALEAEMKTTPDEWKNLKTAIQQILAGERDVETLCEPLNFEDASIITAILEGIENPESLRWFEQEDAD